jgi:hypothetical protein
MTGMTILSCFEIEKEEKMTDWAELTQEINRLFRLKTRYFFFSGCPIFL